MRGALISGLPCSWNGPVLFVAHLAHLAGPQTGEALETESLRRSTNAALSSHAAPGRTWGQRGRPGQDPPVPARGGYQT